MSCYSIDTDILLLNNAQRPCGSLVVSSKTVQQCCADGDSCLSNSICHFTHPSDKTSSFYIGGCTQKSFQDPKYSERCLADYFPQDIIYNSTTTLASSTSTGFSTSTPLSTPFSSTSPITVVSSISSISIVSSTPSGSISHPSSPAYFIHNESSGLTTNAAKAGVGTTGALAGLALAILILNVARRRRNFLACKNHISEKKPMANVHDDNRALSPCTGPHLAAIELNAERVTELDSNAKVELDAVMGGGR